ncbi:MFS transporter [Blastococcus xanthinilyticus]|uniref:Putative MFS family arabinose efflux permease n=1 Tax=Blastococcus xanthinilyticus TaxID=1564164 RepID=A0A5S5CSS4_9ACTN|nr:MFS transporter [Blastococcus xanthinilyticus]TYP86851.1 putative MFS family arabinose efflux permease [Blastococcus xanthinilyticus]
MDGGGGPEPGPAVPRPSRRLITDPLFGPYWAGKLLANVGIWIQNIASASLVWQLTSSAFLVGLVSFAQFVPQLVLTPLSGAMADRGSPRRQILLGRTLCTLGAAVLAGWVLLTADVADVPPWVVMATALVVGLGFSVGGPAMQALLPSLVRDGEVARAVALDNLTFSVGRAVGPAVGGVVAASAGYGVAFLLAAIGHLVFLGAVFRLRTPGAATAPGPRLSVVDGVRYLRTDPVVGVLLLGVTAVGIGADPAVTLGPSLADVLGGGPELVGVLASAFGAGAFLGFFVQVGLVRYLDHAWLATSGLVLLGISAVGLALSWNVPVAVTAFVVGGVGLTLAMNGVTTLLYARVPRAYIGRIMALWLVGFVGSRPLAATLNGALTDLVSVGAALLTTAVVLAGAAAVCRPAVLRRAAPEA